MLCVEPGAISATEIVTPNEKRRHWTWAEKRRRILALEAPDANALDLARSASVSPRGVYLRAWEMGGG